MSKVLLPGSYDPMTLGHIEIIKRCSSIFDEVVVMIGYNDQKKGFLSPQKRKQYAIDALKDLDNVTVECFSGLVVDFVVENDIDLIVKGIRNEKDLDYESEMTFVNRDISFKKFGRSVETLYMKAAPEYVYTSSSLVRQLLEMGLSVDSYVHDQAFLLSLIKE